MTNKKAMSIVKAAFKKVYKGVFTKDELDGIFYTGKNDPGEWATTSRVVVHAESVGLSYEDYGYDEFCGEVEVKEICLLKQYVMVFGLYMMRIDK